MARTIKELRAIASPARVRLYGILLEDKRATVGQLAAKSGLAVGSVSYHLQQLLKAGLVQEVDGEGKGDRREHWWAPVKGGLRMEPSDFKDSPTGREVASAAQIAVAERRVRWLSYWHMTWHEWSKEWLDASAETDVLLRLTSDELAQMSAELHAVINRWYRLSEEMRESKTDASGPSRQRCLAFINAFPLPDEEKQ